MASDIGQYLLKYEVEIIKTMEVYRNAMSLECGVAMGKWDFIWVFKESIPWKMEIKHSGAGKPE